MDRITRFARACAACRRTAAQRAGVERRRSFFRVDAVKANLAPPADQADWHHLVSVDLGNGDNVVVVTQWTWPNAFDGVSVHDLRKVQSAVAAQAKDWVGHAVADVFKLDASNRAARAKIISLLKTDQERHACCRGGRRRQADAAQVHRGRDARR